MQKEVVSKEIMQELITKLEEIVNNYCWNLESFTDEDINSFFDGTEEEVTYYKSLIVDSIESTSFLWSSKKIAEKIAESIIKSSEYTNNLIKNMSSIQLEWCETDLPSIGEANKIYILPTNNGIDTVNTLNIWNSTTYEFISIGNLEIDLTNYYTKTETDEKLDLKANTDEVISNDKIVQTLDSDTNSADTILSTNGLQVELNKLVENLTTINEDIEWAEFTLMEDTPMVDKDYVPFTLSRGNINIDNGLFTLKANKIYFVTLITRGNDIYNVDETIQQFYSVALMDIKSQTKYIITFHDVQREELHRADVPSSSTVIKPSEDMTLGAKVTNLFGDYNSFVAKQTKIVVVEIPSPTSIINVTEDYIKEIQEQQITTIIDSNSTNKQIPNALAVYDSCIKDKIIKTYVSLSSLGLNSGCSVGDIFNAMPDGSIGRFDFNGSTISGLPITTGGMLSIDKHSVYRFDIQFKSSAGGSIANNELYIGQLQGLDGSGLTWEKMITTTDLEWKILNINLSSSLEGWNQKIINVRELIGRREIKLFDSVNECWTSTIENLGEAQGRIWYTNGLGKGDIGMFSQRLIVNFVNGDIANVTCRELSSTGNYPIFTKVAYR